MIQALLKNNKVIWLNDNEINLFMATNRENIQNRVGIRKRKIYEVKSN